MAPASLRNRRFSWLVQASFVAVVVLVAWFLIDSTRKNLEVQGVTLGFDFLFRSTGWNINYSLIPYSPTDPYWKVLVIGLMNTLWLGFISLVTATILGVLIAVARTVNNRVLRIIGLFYVESVRSVPVLLQLFFWFAVYSNLPGPRQAISYGDMVFVSGRGVFVPGLNVSAASGALALAAALVTLGVLLWVGQARRFRRMEPWPKRGLLLGILLLGAAVAAAVLGLGRVPGTDLVSIPARRGLNFVGGVTIGLEIVTMITAITVYGAAYISEIVRAGLVAVGKGQIEAARALGLGGWHVFTRIHMPLAIRAMLPSLTNQYVWLMKATTLGIAIGFTDFFMVVAVSITQSGHTIELIAILMAGFLLINYTLARVFNWINRMIALPGSRVSS